MNTISFSDSHLLRHKCRRLSGASALLHDSYYFMQTATRQAPAGKRRCSLSVLSGCKLHQRCMKNSALSLSNIRPTYCKHTHTHTQWPSHMRHGIIHVVHTCEKTHIIMRRGNNWRDVMSTVARRSPAEDRSTSSSAAPSQS